MEVGSKEDSVSIKGKPRPRGYWTIERSLEEARKYKSRKEFVESSPSAYRVLGKNGLLRKVHFESDEKRKPDGYWTIERSLEEAKKYRTRADFNRNSRSAYKVLCASGKLDECGLDVIVKPRAKKQEPRKPRGYWTTEKCFEVSKLCGTRSEFRRKFPSAYTISLRNKLLDGMQWLKPPQNVNVDGWFLYKYVFLDMRIYIGVATNLKRRDSEHNGMRKNKNDSAVYNYHLKSGLPIPEMVVVKSGLSAENARKMEIEYINMYKNDKNYVVLNRVKGGSLGSVYKKWTSDKKIEDEARKYKTLKDFRLGNPSAYTAAQKRGVLKKFDFLVRGRHETWTRESFMEYVKSKGYKTLSEFSKDPYYLAMYRLKITAGELGLKMADAPRPVYAFRSDNGQFIGKFESQGAASRALGVLNIGNCLNGKCKRCGDYVFSYDGKCPKLPGTKKKGFWTFENCKRVGLEDGSRKKFWKNHNGGYNSAKKHGWLDKIFGQIEKCDENGKD